MANIRSFLNLMCITAVIWLSTILSETDACMCDMQHPQITYCNSEYVIYARVLKRKVIENPHPRVAYKIDIRKKYRMSEKAEFHLSKGILYTPPIISTCGINLDVGKLYVIMGKSSNITLCDFIKPVSSLRFTEKRAITVGYKHGCQCKFNKIFGNGAHEYKPHECNYSPKFGQNCEMDYGVCVPKYTRSRRAHSLVNPVFKCHWRMTEDYKNCLENP